MLKLANGFSDYEQVPRREDHSLLPQATSAVEMSQNIWLYMYMSERPCNEITQVKRCIHLGIRLNIRIEEFQGNECLAFSAINVYSFIHSFIHSFRAFLQRPFKSSTTQRRSRLQHGYCIGVSRRSAQETVGKGLAQGPYMAARAGVEPTTLRLKAIDSTKAPTCHNLTFSM